MAPRTKVSVLAVAVVLSACLDSDELPRSNPESESSGETVAMYNDDTAGSSDDNWTAEETGPGEITCRDAIDCLVTCQSELIINPMPEPDLSCFLNCDGGLTTEEAYLLIKLAECIGNKCAEDPDGAGMQVSPCGPEPETSDNDCLICLAAYGQDPQPPGCIDEAAACQ